MVKPNTNSKGPMESVGEFKVKDTKELFQYRRSIKKFTLKTMEEIFEVVKMRSPQSDEVGLSILSEMVAGDSIRKICQLHQLWPEQVNERADQALKTIRETLFCNTDLESDMPEKHQKAIDKMKREKQKLEAEVELQKQLAKEAEQRYNKLERETVEIISNSELRDAYMRHVPIHRQPVSPELKSFAAKCDFYTLGDVIDIHPYNLITKYKFTRQLIDDLEDYIKAAGLERKIINK